MPGYARIPIALAISWLGRFVVLSHSCSCRCLFSYIGRFVALSHNGLCQNPLPSRRSCVEIARDRLRVAPVASESQANTRLRDLAQCRNRRHGLMGAPRSNFGCSERHLGA